MMIYPLFRQLLFRLDAEHAHQLTLSLLDLAGRLSPVRAWLRRSFCLQTPDLACSVAGLQFANPVGLAAGYDKDGTAALGLSCLGFSHLELGTVTPQPQPGNQKPRIFRLVEDQALINRMGFPNQGGVALMERLRHAKPAGVVVGVNIGKGANTPLDEAAEDYLRLWHLMAPVADYIAVNVSSPNTVGLRRLQAKDMLESLLGQLTRARSDSRLGKQPIFVKLAPDLSLDEMNDAVESTLRTGVDGLIATNTTIRRPGDLRSSHRQQPGGLSGIPLQPVALSFVRQLAQMVDGRLPIIGVGGVQDGPSAAAMLSVGAALVQVYTGLVYQGPSLVRRILIYLQATQSRSSL